MSPAQEGDPTGSWRREVAEGPTAAMRDAARYFNRERSWLAFNRRVLEEAEDQSKPLFERAKFLAIVSSNLDEFVMVRLAELRAVVTGQEPAPSWLSRAQAAEDLTMIRALIGALVADQYRCWRDDIAPRLAAQSIVIVPAAEWAEADREGLRRLYRDKLEPVLTPLAVDPTRPFPLLANRGIHVAVQLVPHVGGGPRTALVSVPGANRLVALVGLAGRFALVEEVVTAFLDTLFPGYRITGRCAFRITRDGTLDFDEDQAQDLLSEIEQELSSREHGQAVRIEVSAGVDAALRQWLMTAMGLEAGDIVAIDGPLDLTVLNGLGERVNRPDLRDRPFISQVHPSAAEWEDPFARIRAGEILLNHPFESFQPIVDLVARAAADTRVLAIKQTLYRVSGDSPVVKALIQAARAGKQVTVLIELKARFDEAINIQWARRLEQAGAHVIYGLVGYKVHAKLLMIIRRDEDGIRRYVHIGTGNYNDKTAKQYTDLSYITDNEAVGRDVAALFNMLTGYSRPPEWERLAVAPLNMRRSFVQWIRREADNARAGRGGRIISKFNSLVDQEICDELYAASQAGVEIDLIVRGMCVLRPGVPKLSETIRVRSLVGRFLEHNRIYWFANRGPDGERPVVAIASADWMTRNLDRRVECLVHIEDAALQRRLAAILHICLGDDAQARVLEPDGTYRRLRPRPGGEAHTAIELLAGEAAAWARPGPDQGREALPFKPQRKR